MAPYIPEEVDVFTVPHSRMKALVNDYFTKLENTDFADDLDLEVLLQTLYKTFVEFKRHEHIENKYIMKRLKGKLQELSIRNTAVCNCHKDSQLTHMLRLVSDGYNKKTLTDRINYGLQLKAALEEFAEEFLPHMKQEEEVFQPLLLKYFSYEELRDLRLDVIQRHLEKIKLEEQRHHQRQEDKETTAESESSDDDDLCNEPAVDSVKDEAIPKLTVQDLPQEVLLNVFSYLNPQDLCRTAQVSSSWAKLTYDPTLWKQLHPVKWAQGNWSYQSPGDDEEEEEEEDDVDEEDTEYVMIDEDADIDESEDNSEDDFIRQLQHEARILVGLTKYVLPKVGEAVEVVNLANSRVATNTLVNRMIRQCVNVEVLDLTQTRLSDAGLKSVGKNGVGHCLRKLNVTGCVNVTDATLMRVGHALNLPSADDTTQELDSSPVADKNNPLTSEMKNTEKQQTDLKLDAEQKNDCFKQITTVDSGHYGSAAGSAESAKNPVITDPCVNQNITLVCDRENGQNAAMPKPEMNERLHDGGQMSSRCMTHDSIVTLCCHSPCAGKPGDVPLVIEDCAVYKKVLLDNDASSAGTVNETPPSHMAPLWSLDLVPKNDAPHSDLVDFGKMAKKPNKIRTLEYLNLSGCYQITDGGLRALAAYGLYDRLTFLDLSGLYYITGEGLADFVDACPNIDPELLSYCDNIDGPFADVANGCQNVECGKRYCCRKGH